MPAVRFGVPQDQTDAAAVACVPAPALRGSTPSRNVTPWRQIADFLEDQELSKLGLRMVRRSVQA